MRRDAAERRPSASGEKLDQKPVSEKQSSAGAARAASASSARPKTAAVSGATPKGPASGAAPKADAIPATKTPAALDDDGNEKPAAKDKPRLPLSGIHLVLDDGEKADAHDALDSDFKEF
jgi:hypothetical protein